MNEKKSTKYQISLLIIVIITSLIAYYFLEVKLALFLHSLDPKSIYDPFFKFINDYTYYINPILSVIFILCVIFGLSKLKTQFFLITIANYTALGFVHVFGNIIGKSRPSALYDSGFHGIIPFHSGHAFTSIPSGYITTYTATCVAIYFAFGKNKALGVVLFIIDLLIIISALLNSHHYLSSAIISSYFGYLIALLLYTFFIKQNKLYSGKLI